MFARIAIAGLAAGAMLVGCSAVTAAPDAPKLDGTAWTLAALPGRTLVADARATLSFEGGRAGGSDGCNRFSGGYTSVAPGTMQFTGGKGISTMMACDAAVMQQAEAFRSAMAAARSYRVEGKQLHLVDAGGKIVATLAAQSQALTGTAWDATGINNGRQAVVSLATGTKVTLAFGADGMLSGSAGCNRYTARFQAGSGGKLSISMPAATRRACSDEKAMEQEQAFLNALATVTTARVEGDTLELRTADGALAVMARRVP